MPASGALVASAVLAAAVLHAGWNAMAKGVTDRLGLFVRMAVVSVAVAGPALVWTAPPLRPSWPWLAASVVVHLGYNLALMAAYRVGDFNQTYPLARGIGPLIVAGVAVALIGESLPAPATAGVLLIAGAIGVVGLTPWRKVRANRPALAAAVLTGVAIGAYTVIDGIGVRRSGSPVSYTLWLVGLQGLVTVAVFAGIRWAAARRAGAGAPAVRAGWPTAVTAAAMSVLAYGLVLWAQTHGALAAVAALRESSVVVAAVIGMVVFDEPMGRIRVAASIAVAAGVVLLAAGV